MKRFVYFCLFFVRIPRSSAVGTKNILAPKGILRSLMWSSLFLFVFLYPLPYTIYPILAHSEVVTVKMMPSGFEPNTITIDQSSTVIFINQDKRARWPASNVHPTHDQYPEFDPKKPIQQGESWSFKAFKTGEWRYHDHLYPHIRGVLIVSKEENQGKVEVVDLFAKIRTTLGSLVSKISKLFSTRQVLGVETFIKLTTDEQIALVKKIAQQEGPSGAWEYLLQAFKGQPGSSGNIHDLAHLVGSLVYEKEGFTGLNVCTAEFAFGCFHGFLDKAFSKSLEQLPLAQAACLKLGPQNSGPVASCIHGIGHGIASFYSTDLKKSLSSCSKLTSGREYCFDGVFMEFVRSAPDTAFKKEDLLYPCDQLEKEFGSVYSFACGRNQPSLLMSRFKLGFDEVAGICVGAFSQPFKQACFDSLGFSLASEGDGGKIISGCQKIGEPEFIARCIKAAAGELVFQEVPGWEEKSRIVCNSLAEGVSECQAYIEKLILEYGRKVKINFRNINPEEDVNSYIRSQLKVCFDNGGRDGCYKSLADTLYSQFGLSQNLELLKDNENYPEVYARCHEVTHYLSRQEFDKQKSIAKVYAKCDSTCHGGCYHGVLEAYLKEKDLSASSDLGTEFQKACGKQSDYQKPLEFNECLHGLGHAAMFVYDMDLKKSLILCDTLNSQEHIERCYTGAFMENSSSSTSFDHASIYIKTDDPFYPCNSLEEKYQAVCWQYQSSYFSIISKQDWEKVADMCLQIPQQYQDKCFRTVGTNQVGFTQSFKVMKNDCEVMPTAHFQNICVAGVVSSLSYRFVGDSQKMIDFCSIVKVDNQQSCFKQMGVSLLDWSVDKNLAKNECNKIPDQQGSFWCQSVI